MSVRTDVLQPRLPHDRVSRAALAVVAVALIGIPLFQLSVGSGSVTNTEGAYAPKIRVIVDQFEFAPGQAIRGVVTISAIDAATLQGPVELSVYPAGAPQTEANQVGSAQLSPSRLSLSAQESVALPFSLQLTGIGSGSYNVNAELAARVDKGNLHSISSTIAAATFTIR